LSIGQVERGPAGARNGTAENPEATLKLKVTRSEFAAEGIRLFELRRPTGGELPAFTPGSHIPVRVPNGSLRNYSLCSDPVDHSRYVIAVKREEGGRGGSISLIDNVQTGDIVEVLGPRNLFELTDSASSYIFVAGGIGITPIVSMVHWVRARDDKPFKLYYLTRNSQVTAFLADLNIEELKSSVTIHHDDGAPENAFDLWPIFEKPTKAHIYCCGPRPLIESVKDMTGHWPINQVHFEDFGSDLVRPRSDDKPFKVRLARSNTVLEIPVGTSILEIMRAHGLRAPSSCESGTCGTCKMRLIAGEVNHRDLVLTAAERVDNIMICVSRAKNDELVLDA
jgi:phthalate 4,5-dioxygenase reductase subunit